MIRVGVVGVGHMGWLHARNLAGIDGCRLEAVYDVDAPRAKRAAGAFGCAAPADLRELLSSCDAVVVAVPTRVHHPVALAALEAGAHVFVEKPIATTLEEADALADAALASGKALAVGHVERFNPAFTAVRERLGRPLFVEAHRLAPFVPRSVDVDVVADLMIHDLDLLLRLEPDEPTHIHASGVAVVTGREDIANARVGFPDGAVANLTASRVSRERMRRMRVFVEGCYVSMDFLRRSAEVVRLAADPREWIARGVLPPVKELVERITIGPFPEANPLADELVDFVRAAAGEKPPEVGPGDARRALALSLRVRRRVVAHLESVRAARAAGRGESRT